MSQTLWLFVLLSVVGLISGQNPLLPTVPNLFLPGGQNPFLPEPGHGLIDGSYVKVREELIKNIRLVAGGGKDGGSSGGEEEKKETNSSSAPSQSVPALPTLPSFPPFGGLPNFQPFQPFQSFQPLPYARQNNDCVDCKH